MKIIHLLVLLILLVFIGGCAVNEKESSDGSDMPAEDMTPSEEFTLDDGDINLGELDDLDAVGSDDIDQDLETLDF